MNTWRFDVSRYIERVGYGISGFYGNGEGCGFDYGFGFNGDGFGKGWGEWSTGDGYGEGPTGVGMRSRLGWGELRQEET
jgi:hypothetical protein